MKKLPTANVDGGPLTNDGPGKQNAMPHRSQIILGNGAPAAQLDTFPLPHQEQAPQQVPPFVPEDGPPEDGETRA